MEEAAQPKVGTPGTAGKETMCGWIDMEKVSNKLMRLFTYISIFLYESRVDLHLRNKLPN